MSRSPTTGRATPGWPRRGSGSTRAGSRRSGTTAVIPRRSPPSSGPLDSASRCSPTGGGTEALPEILAQAYVNASFVLQFIRRLDDALQAALRAYELAERASREHLGDPSAARTRVWATMHACEMLRTKGRIDEARRLFGQGIAFGRVWVGEHPRDLEMRLNLAGLEGDLGIVEKYSGSSLEALKILQRVTDGLGALARENPLVIRARWYWANFLLDLSQLQSDLGRYREAEHSARTSIELSEALMREVPSNSLFRLIHGGGYTVLGKARVKAGSPGETLAMFRKAVATYETYNDDFPDTLMALAQTLALASTVADPAEGPAAAGRQSRDADRALAAIRRAIELGFANPDMLKDPDFASLRSRPTSSSW